MADDPHALFERWFAEARLAEPNDPDAMTLATVDAEGRPSARMVLLKGHDAARLRLLHQPAEPQGRRSSPPIRSAALLFHWKSLRRQVRIEGAVERGRGRAGRRLFRDAARAIRSSAPGPRTSRARWTSARPSRGAFEAMQARFEGGDVPRPPHWWRLSRRARADRILAAIARTACTSGACSRRTGDGWSEGLLYP